MNNGMGWDNPLGTGNIDNCECTFPSNIDNIGQSDAMSRATISNIASDWKFNKSYDNTSSTKQEIKRWYFLDLTALIAKKVGVKPGKVTIVKIFLWFFGSLCLVID